MLKSWAGSLEWWRAADRPASPSQRLGRRQKAYPEVGSRKEATFSAAARAGNLRAEAERAEADLETSGLWAEGEDTPLEKPKLPQRKIIRAESAKKETVPAQGFPKLGEGHPFPAGLSKMTRSPRGRVTGTPQGCPEVLRHAGPLDATQSYVACLSSLPPWVQVIN